MGINALFEESVRNGFSDPIELHVVNEKMILVEFWSYYWRYTLDEKATKIFRKNLPYSSVVYKSQSHAGVKEKEYCLKLETQSLLVKEYPLGNSIVLESKFRKEKQTMNSAPAVPLNEAEFDAVKMFYGMIVNQTKNRKETRIRFALGMMGMEHVGALRKLMKFPEYRHVKL